MKTLIIYVNDFEDAEGELTLKVALAPGEDPKVVRSTTQELLSVRVDVQVEEEG